MRKRFEGYLNIWNIGKTRRKPLNLIVIWKVFNLLLDFISYNLNEHMFCNFESRCPHHSLILISHRPLFHFYTNSHHSTDFISYFLSLLRIRSRFFLSYFPSLLEIRSRFLSYFPPLLRIRSRFYILLPVTVENPEPFYILLPVTVKNPKTFFILLPVIVKNPEPSLYLTSRHC